MTLTMVLIGLLALAGLLAIAIAVIMGIVFWIAAGESDVNGDPERDADPTQPNALPGWDAEIMCAICGVHLDGPRLPSGGTTYFRICDKCRKDAEEEINDVAHAKCELRN